MPTVNTRRRSTKTEACTSVNGPPGAAQAGVAQLRSTKTEACTSVNVES